MNDAPCRELAPENLLGSGESLLPAYHVALGEIEFLREMEQRNLAYPFRSSEADAELFEIRRELAGWLVLIES